MTVNRGGRPRKNDSDRVRDRKVPVGCTEQDFTMFAAHKEEYDLRSMATAIRELARLGLEYVKTEQGKAAALAMQEKAKHATDKSISPMEIDTATRTTQAPAKPRAGKRRVKSR